MYDSVFAEILSGKSCHIATCFGWPWPQNMTIIVDVSLLGATFVKGSAVNDSIYYTCHLV